MFQLIVPFARRLFDVLAIAIFFACCCVSGGCQRAEVPATGSDVPAQPVELPVDKPVTDKPAETKTLNTAFVPLDDHATNRPKQSPHDGYASSSACLECHPNQHESWSHSYHRTMTQIVGDDTVAGGFDGKTKRIFAWDYTAEKRGDDYWCKLDSTDGSGASFEYQLVMSTGSHHMQKFWYHTGKSRKMGMAPLVYLIEADKWMPEKSAFLSPPDHKLRLREVRGTRAAFSVMQRAPILELAATTTWMHGLPNSEYRARPATVQAPRTSLKRRRNRSSILAILARLSRRRYVDSVMVPGFERKKQRVRNGRKRGMPIAPAKTCSNCDTIPMERRIPTCMQRKRPSRVFGVTVKTE